jgi:hypothetical protein
MDTRRILLGEVALALSVVSAGFMLSSKDLTPVGERSRQTAIPGASSVPIVFFKPNGAHFKPNTELVQEPAHRPPPPPPPPPPPAGTGKGRLSESPIEKPRIFIGPTRAQMKSIERALPPGSSVYVGPVGVDYETAAIAEADVDGDGVAETVVVHTQRQATDTEPRPPLVLSVLSRQGKRYLVRMSISLVGNILFNIDTNEGLLSVVIQDITGDGQPKIVVAPGPSASLGGWLEAYDVHGTKFSRLVHINGRYFRLRRLDKAVSITARWMEEDEESVYKWNGTEFHRVATPR